MVHSEMLSVDVIKVTIRDKPACQKRPVDGDLLREAFRALREHALCERAERHSRQVELEDRIANRRVLRCLRAWRHRASEPDRAKARKQLSNEQRIEQLVGVIAKKQQDALKPKEPARGNSRGSSGDSRRPRKPVVRQQRPSAKPPSREPKHQEVQVTAKQCTEQTIKVARQALRQCDQRTRRSLIHLMREQGCRSAGEVPEVPNGPPEFLLRMEQRAQTRKQRIQQLDELHQRQREEQKRREEAVQREEQERERLRRLQALREARKARREQEERRLRRLQAQQQLEATADQCYRRYLFRRYVLEPLTSLVEERRGHLRLAEQHHGRKVTSRAFAAWRSEWAEQRAGKLELAARFHRHVSLWRSFDEWRGFAVDMKQKLQVAVDFNDMKIQSRHFRALNQLRVELKEHMQEQEARAISHHNRRLISVYFGIWKHYTMMADDIKGREQRRDEWRDLIHKFIPATNNNNVAALRSSKLCT